MRSARHLPLLIWLLGVIALAVASPFAAAHDTFPGDVWLTDRLQDIDSEAFETALSWPSALATWWYMLPVALLAGAVLYAARGGWVCALPLVVLVASRPVIPLLKELIERPRPSPSFVEVAAGQPESFSFPSGHAFNAMLLYGLIFYLATVYIRPAWPRLTVQAACLWVVLLTPLERVYSGRHWPSDVAAGLLTGALVLAVVIALERGVGRSRLGPRPTGESAALRPGEERTEAAP